MTYQEINQNKSIEPLPNEIFKDIPGYEGYYQVSNLGRVKSLRRKFVIKDKILKYEKNKNGYLKITLSKNKKVKYPIIHRLVMLTFKGLSKLHVNHIDGNKENNQLNNLEYCTIAENNRHAWNNGLMEHNREIARKTALEKFKSFNEIKKKPVKQYDLKGNFIEEYESACDAKNKTLIAQESISRCCRGIRNHAGGYIWKYDD